MGLAMLRARNLDTDLRMVAVYDGKGGTGIGTDGSIDVWTARRDCRATSSTFTESDGRRWSTLGGLQGADSRRCRVSAICLSASRGRYCLETSSDSAQSR